MRLLMIGGTRFLGRAFVDTALAHGYEVTIFTRGQTNPGLYADAERLVGDRESDLSALEGREWDAVVDTCGYLPDVVERSVALLSKAVEHYTFVSSMSTYRGWPEEAVDETSPTRAPGEVGEDGGYGANKAACERVVDSYFPGRSVFLRCGLIVGPYEDVGRLPYWLLAAARGGPMLAPAPPDRTIQLIDSRDIAHFALDLAEARRPGTFNVTSPEGEVTFRDLVTACLDATDSDAEPVWVSDATLQAAGVEEWTELPMWLPASHAGTWSADVSRAQEAGLRFRPLPDTARDTWEWLRHVDDFQPRWPWITPEKAAAVLESRS
jgi:2'-hydroxyisoflavone reductase